MVLPPASRLGARLGAAAPLLLAALGAGLVVTGLQPRGPVPPAPAAAQAAAGLPPTIRQVAGTRGKAVSRPAPMSRSVPVRLDIPAIGVHTAVVPLGLRADGAIDLPPPDPHAPAGWYRHLVTPGEAGPAVILGHVDSARAGPAVFFRLGELVPGDRVTVTRADGSRAGFTVRAVQLRPKSSFPSRAVYGPVPDPELRLVTCGGRFDARRGSYLDNVIVFASLTWPAGA